MTAQEPPGYVEACGQAPVGTVTFLLTDIEGSTRLWEQYPSEMREALRHHNSILSREIEEQGGFVVTSRGEGDSFFAVFASAIEAINAAAKVQRRLFDEQWPDDCPVKVRMALHTGEAEYQDGEYHGHAAINRCARLRAAAHGGQVLLTRATRDLVTANLGGLELRDLGEHRLRDLREPAQVYQLVVPSLPSEFPPILTLAGRSNNLPIQTTSFVGRGAELSMVGDLMSRHRVVTLVGAGGSGKTRLALQVAAQLIEHFPDGTWLVELASLADPNLVPPQIAAALHMGELDVEKLRPKTLLIVLDNCEHLLRSCATVVSFLVRECPGISVLSTSREPLEVPGEQLVRLSALTPGDARQLLFERAALVRPDFARDESQDPAVDAICRRLDGIPLAIELAAARASSMSPAEILEGLEDRFALLKTRSSLSPERHQTLRAAVTWSYDLLDQREQWLFRHLSVFSGGWSAAAACAVCGEPFASEAETRDSLSALVDKSLVVATGRATSRYSMLETLHQFAQEMLRKDKAAEAQLQHRHADYFLSLSSASDWPTETWWLDRRVREVLVDLDNFRAAIAWSRISAPEMEIGLVVGAAPLWMAAGRYAEGKAALHEALARNREPTALRLRALEHLGWLSAEQGDLETASSTANDALRVAEKLGSEEVATAQSLLGYVALQKGELEQAERFLAMSLAAFRATDNRTKIARVRHHQAALAMKNGDRGTAESLFDEVVELGNQSGDPGLVTYALISAIPLLVDQQRVGEAREKWQRAYECSGGEGPEMLNLAILGYAAWIAAAEGRPVRAVALTEAALALQEQTGWQDEWLLGWFWRTLAVAYEAADATSLRDAQSRGRDMSVPEALAFAASDRD